MREWLEILELGIHQIGKPGMVIASNTQIGYSKKLHERSFQITTVVKNVASADTKGNINIYTLLTLWMGQLDYQHSENREM